MIPGALLQDGPAVAFLAHLPDVALSGGLRGRGRLVDRFKQLPGLPLFQIFPHRRGEHLAP